MLSSSPGIEALYNETNLSDPFFNVTVIARRNDSSTTADDSIDQLHINLLGYFLMSTFLVILSIILVILVYHVMRQRQLLYYSRRETSSNQQPSRSMLLRIQRRYETIEHWIITKQVQAHDDFCDKVVTNFGHHDDADEGVRTCQPVKLDDTDQRECPICMSALTQGQVVSWSANDACSHVYHHQCIKEWLLRHVDCCLCKNIFLPVDEKKGRAKEAALQDLSCQYAAASATSYYCARTGLVRIPRSVRCTKAELVQLERRIFGGTVVPTKLASIRGSREASTSRNDDMLPIVSSGDPLTTSSTFSNTSDTIVDEEVELPTSSDDVIAPVDSTSSSQQRPQAGPRDVELGDQELLTASYHLEMEKSRIGDNRCCIDDSDDSVEVKETSSSGHIQEEEESTSETLDHLDWQGGNS